MTEHDQPPEIDDEFILKMLQAIVADPIGAQLLELCEGKREIVLRNNPNGSGWVVRLEKPGAPIQGYDVRLPVGPRD